MISGAKSIEDENLKVEIVVEGLNNPTGMEFLGTNDILVLERDNGTVKRIVDGQINQTLLDVKVANEHERGMLGMAVAKNDTTTYVFLYYSESSGEDGSDYCPHINECDEAYEPKGNRLYRYELEGDKLVNPKLLLDVPASPGSDHVGGFVTIGPDSNVYVVTGDGDSCFGSSCFNNFNDTVLNSQTANQQDGQRPSGRGGILRITQDGEVVGPGILGNDDPLSKYYAYGIRNSFGMDFDPVTGNLWDTENGPAFGDEINLVEPGFNSGWLKSQGVWPIFNHTLLLPKNLVPPYRGYIWEDMIGNSTELDTSGPKLVDFQEKGKYSDPEFVWNRTIGVTSIKFLNSDKLGKEYENDIFVASSNGPYIYHFDLTEDRKELLLGGPLKDKVANNPDELQANIFGRDFGGITDMEVGPDGFLYVLSISKDRIWRIVPIETKE
jgi:glucose/arabinose dehydrogenase